ncbi:hypothetical protein B0H12DRAFT_968029, partial [Mycena haematopus]
LERRYGWAQGGKALPTTHRPAQVTLWLGQGRGQRPGIMSQGRGPNVSDIDAFAEHWWDWWNSIQPAWRKGTGDNPTAHAQEYPDSGDETSWSPLRSPGANGMCIVVATLYWWGMAVKRQKKARENWLQAVADVEWMIRGLEGAEPLSAESEEP